CGGWRARRTWRCTTSSSGRRRRRTDRLLFGLDAEGAKGDPQTLGRAAPPMGPDRGRRRRFAPRERRGRVRPMHRAMHRTGRELPPGSEGDALPRDADVLRDDVRPGGPPAVFDGRARGAPDPQIRIDDEIPGGRERDDEPFDQLDRELAWVDRLLHVVGLHVGEDPHVARVLSQRVAAVLADVLPLPGSLAGVLLGDPDGIEVEGVGVTFGEPQDHLVASREAARAVQAVLEVPDDAIAQPKLVMPLETWEQHDVEREDAVGLDVVADLPADAAARTQDADAFRDHGRLSGHVFAERTLAGPLVRLADVVRGRRNDELRRSGWDVP